jgi:hypothetical protein
MRKSIAAAAILTLAVTLAAPIASAASRPQQTATAAARATEPREKDGITRVIRRVIRKLMPVGNVDEPVHPTIPIP